MTYLSRAVFAGASLLLLLSAMALIGFGVSDAIHSIRSPEKSGADAVLDVLGYVIVAIAVFDVAKYIFEDEVRRGNDKRSAAEARRSLTKFLSTIVIALFLEALVVVFKFGADLRRGLFEITNRLARMEERLDDQARALRALRQAPQEMAPPAPVVAPSPPAEPETDEQPAVSAPLPRP